MINYLPSKKIIFRLIIPLLVLFAVFWIANITEKYKKNKIYDKNFSSRAAESSDKDGDGLKDWQEVLWKTDINNPDTDGDGTADGDEVSAGRDPNKPFPDDKIIVSENSLNTKTSPPKLKYKDGENMTDYISKEFLVNYFDLKNKGVDVAKELPNILDKKIDNKQYPYEYFPEDIIIKESDSMDDITSYINDAGHALTKNFTELRENELKIIKEAVNSKNYADLKKLSLYIYAYNKTTKDLLKTPAPPSVAHLHLELINESDHTSKALIDIQKMEEDTYLALEGLSEYMAILERVNNTISEINSIIEEKGISISSYEPGYVFIDYFDKMKK